MGCRCGRGPPPPIAGASRGGHPNIWGGTAGGDTPGGGGAGHGNGGAGTLGGPQGCSALPPRTHRVWVCKGAMHARVRVQGGGIANTPPPVQHAWALCKPRRRRVRACKRACKGTTRPRACPRVRGRACEGERARCGGGSPCSCRGGWVGAGAPCEGRACGGRACEGRACPRSVSSPARGPRAKSELSAGPPPLSRPRTASHGPSHAAAPRTASHGDQTPDGPRAAPCTTARVTQSPERPHSQPLARGPDPPARLATTPRTHNPALHSPSHGGQTPGPALAHSSPAPFPLVHWPCSCTLIPRSHSSIALALARSSRSHYSTSPARSSPTRICPSAMLLHTCPPFPLIHRPALAHSSPASFPLVHHPYPRTLIPFPPVHHPYPRTLIVRSHSSIHRPSPCTLIPVLFIPQPCSCTLLAFPLLHRPCPRTLIHSPILTPPSPPPSHARPRPHPHLSVTPLAHRWRPA